MTSRNKKAQHSFSTGRAFYWSLRQLLVSRFFVHFLIKHTAEKDRHADDENDDGKTSQTHIRRKQFFPGHDGTPFS